MFKTLTIEHFRNFEHLAIGPLARVNLIAGKNNVGKTALLEALFLQMGPAFPELSIALNGLRGIERSAVDAEDIWGWLFFGKRTNIPIKFETRDYFGVIATLELRLVEAAALIPVEVSAVMPAENLGSVSNATSRDLEWIYRDSRGQEGISRIVLDREAGLRPERASLSPPPPGVFLGSAGGTPRENAARFSQLDAVGKIQGIVSALQIVEPRLVRLALLVTGGVPIIHGDIGLGRMIPVNYIGDGIRRMLNILLAISSTQHGIVLVDEIENGLHYSIIRQVWKAIRRASLEYDVQVFATTHSYECIVAAHEAFEDGSDDDFRLHRLDRVSDTIKATTYNEATLGTSIKAEMEVR